MAFFYSEFWLCGGRIRNYTVRHTGEVTGTPGWAFPEQGARQRAGREAQPDPPIPTSPPEPRPGWFPAGDLAGYAIGTLPCAHAEAESRPKNTYGAGQHLRTQTPQIRFALPQPSPFWGRFLKAEVHLQIWHYSRLSIRNASFALPRRQATQSSRSVWRRSAKNIPTSHNGGYRLLISRRSTLSTLRSVATPL